MGQNRKRPLVVLPGVLKDWFIKASCGSADVMLFAEVRGIDPTVPGLDEFEDIIGSVDLCSEDIAGSVPVGCVQPALRLVALYGRRLDL